MRPLPAGWSPNSTASATRWPSPRSPDSTAEELQDGLRPPRADARLQHPYSRVCVGPDLAAWRVGGGAPDVAAAVWCATSKGVQAGRGRGDADPFPVLSQGARPLAERSLTC